MRHETVVELGSAIEHIPEWMQSICLSLAVYLNVSNSVSYISCMSCFCWSFEYWECTRSDKSFHYRSFYGLHQNAGQNVQIIFNNWMHSMHRHSACIHWIHIMKNVIHPSHNWQNSTEIYGIKVNNNLFNMFKINTMYRDIWFRISYTKLIENSIERMRSKGKRWNVKMHLIYKLNENECFPQ